MQGKFVVKMDFLAEKKHYLFTCELLSMLAVTHKWNIWKNVNDYAAAWRTYIPLNFRNFSYSVNFQALIQTGFLLKKTGLTQNPKWLKPFILGTSHSKRDLQSVLSLNCQFVLMLDWAEISK